MAPSKHGLSGTKIYRVWMGIKGRCYNPNKTEYALYGGRGIGVDQRWRESVVQFAADMGPAPSPTHTIDRIDNDGDYTPENCRWATMSQQMTNRRCTRRVSYDGKNLTHKQWQVVTGIDRRLLSLRIDKLGWSVERALTTPTWQKGRIQPGTVFGRLTVIEETSATATEGRRYLCRCECGQTTEVARGNLKGRQIFSCGCLNRERARVSINRARSFRVRSTSQQLHPEPT